MLLILVNNCVYLCVICNAMKIPLTKKNFSFLMIFLLFISCNTYDKNQISDIEKLSSPNKKFDLYLYTINSGMSFGSNINVLKIEKFGETPNFYNSDFYRVPKSRPFQVKWIDDDHLFIKTISNEENTENKQPLKSEIQNYKGIDIKNECFTMFSTVGNSDFTFSKYYEKNGLLIFKNKSDSIIFNKENFQISIGKNFIKIVSFEINKYDKTKGLAFEWHKLIPQNEMDFRQLNKFSPLKFIEN